MQKDRSFWPEWAHILHQWGLSEVAAALLEAAGPLNVFLAQVVFAGQPFLNRSTGWFCPRVCPSVRRSPPGTA